MRHDGAVMSVSTLRVFLRTVRRRKLTVAVTTAVVVLAAITLSLRQGDLFEASAEVFLSRQNLMAVLTDTPDPFTNQSPDRNAQTQAYLALQPDVARRTLAATNLQRELSLGALLARTRVTPRPNGDLLVFRVRDGDADRAARLATAYAQEFTEYRRELDTAALVQAREDVDRELAGLDAAGSDRGALYSSLVQKQQQLRTMEALQTANAVVVRRAESAEQVAPRTKRNAILGLVLGLLLGIGLAFLRATLDTRIQSEEEVSRHLGLPLLGRLPEPSRRVRKAGLVMASMPASPEAEAFRLLRTNLLFASLERDVRSIMVTSATKEEGKSTTVANLALALARNGQRVVLVDLDLRRPLVATLFGLEGHAGLTDVALGASTLEDALAPITLGGANGDGSRNGQGPAGQSLEVLASGPIPPDTGEFVATNALGDILQRLRERADVVLIDAPPMLHVGDAMALSARVDAILLVSRLNVVRRHMLSDLARLFAASPAHKLGFVATGIKHEEGYGYRAMYYEAPQRATTPVP